MLGRLVPWILALSLAILAYELNRARVQARSEARTSAAELQTALADAARLSQALIDRDRQSRELLGKMDAIQTALQEVKNNDPESKIWALSAVPPPILELMRREAPSWVPSDRTSP